MALLTAKLTGHAITRPRMRTPYNLWGPVHRDLVDPVFRERVLAEDVPAKRHAALRSAIYKELFDELPDEERQEWMDKAEREHKAALDKIDGPLKAGPSTDLRDRQRLVKYVLQFIHGANQTFDPRIESLNVSPSLWSPSWISLQSTRAGSFRSLPEGLNLQQADG